MKVVVLCGGVRKRTALGRSCAASHRAALAIGAGDGHWVMLNVSAAVALQLDQDVALEAHEGLIDAPVRTVVLTDAGIDQIGGLIGLRNGAPIDLYATPSVFESLTTAWPVLPMLQDYCDVHWHVVPVAGDRRIAAFRIDGLPTLEFTAFAVGGSSRHRAAPLAPPRAGDHIALAVHDLATGQRVFCAPELAPLGGTALDWMRQADCVLIDGVPEDADTGSWVQRVDDLPARRKIWLGSEPRESGDSPWAGRSIEFAHDRMEIEL